MKYNILLLTNFILIFHTRSHSQCNNTEKAWEIYFKETIQNLDPIEGIWSRESNTTYYDSYNRVIENYDLPQSKIAIYKDNSGFTSCLIDKNNNFSKLSFTKTSVNGIYLFQIYFSNTSSKSTGSASLTDNGILKFSDEMPKVAVKKMMGKDYDEGLRLITTNNLIKIFPQEKDYKEIQKASGTGFAINSDGLIVTNRHVVNDSKIIKVRGVNGDFSKGLNAKIILEDKNNDLAIIKIDDESFITLGVIPYVLTNKTDDVGTSVFVLGYPLRASMGDEIKLTNGIISSKSGFQGDVTTYQITAAVQPGNSGGPLFNDKGNIVGIVNAKHAGAENVSYAIKASYLLNLIDMMPNPLKLQTVNTLAGKTLSEQVKIVNHFTYIIEVN